MKPENLTLPLEVGKTYTLVDPEGNQYPYTILTTTRKHPMWQVVGLYLDGDREYVQCFGASGVGDSVRPGRPLEKRWRLQDYNPHANLALDAPVWRWDASAGDWKQHHYAGTNGGNPCVWLAGRTSWTCGPLKTRISISNPAHLVPGDQPRPPYP